MVIGHKLRSEKYDMLQLILKGKTEDYEGLEENNSHNSAISENGPAYTLQKEDFHVLL